MRRDVHLLVRKIAAQVGETRAFVRQLLFIWRQRIKPPPEMGTVFAGDYLMGLGTLEQRMMILLDIEKLMSGPELGLIPPKAK